MWCPKPTGPDGSPVLANHPVTAAKEAVDEPHRVARVVSRAERFSGKQIPVWPPPHSPRDLGQRLNQSAFDITKAFNTGYRTSLQRHRLSRFRAPCNPLRPSETRQVGKASMSSLTGDAANGTAPQDADQLAAGTIHWRKHSHRKTSHCSPSTTRKKTQLGPQSIPTSCLAGWLAVDSPPRVPLGRT